MKLATKAAAAICLAAAVSMTGCGRLPGSGKVTLYSGGEPVREWAAEDIVYSSKGGRIDFESEGKRVAVIGGPITVEEGL
jgi:hypothetical protein